MKRVLIIGATSAIAEATARLLAAKDAAFYLVARNPERLQSVADDLRVRSGHGVETATLDLTDYSAYAGIVEQAQAILGELDIVLIAHGTLPDQMVCEASAEETRRQIEVNALSVISLLTHLANHFVQQGHGTIAVISSVAGDRGRQSNYVYGSAKAAVTIFLQGLRNRLHRSGVHVMTVKPGFVDTPMTREFRKGALWASPEQIARGIVRGIERRKDVVYLPGFWRFVMRIIREIPEPIFKRLSL
jgi:decaprenylphospho-beta-D-erythro-pentofuranosid-2-ulose 2-reductase